MEHQLDGADNLVFVHFQKPRGTQQHRRVHIVPASVHAAAVGGEFHARLLPDRQGIHICTEQENFSRLFAAGQSDKPRLTARLRGITHLFQLGLDICQSVFERKTGFRVGVQILPAFHNIRFHLQGFVLQLCYIHNPTPLAVLALQETSCTSVQLVKVNGALDSASLT